MLRTLKNLQCVLFLLGHEELQLLLLLLKLLLMLQLLLLLIRREGPLVVLRCGDRKLLADLVVCIPNDSGREVVYHIAHFDPISMRNSARLVCGGSPDGGPPVGPHLLVNALQLLLLVADIFGPLLGGSWGGGKITSSGTRLSTPNTPLKGVTPVTLDTVVRYANIASGTFCTHW